MYIQCIPICILTVHVSVHFYFEMHDRAMIRIDILHALFSIFVETFPQKNMYGFFNIKMD